MPDKLITRAVPPGFGRERLKTKSLVTGLMVVLTVAAASVQAEEALSAEFLEYLGEYEQFGDEWVDPYSFAENLEDMARLGKDQHKPAEQADVGQQHLQEQIQAKHTQQGNAEQQPKAVGGSSQ